MNSEKLIMVDAIFIRSPHKLWPMVNDADNFLPPQNLLALAASCEQAGFDVRVIDCCINRWGWKTLEKVISKLNPALIGAGGPIIWSNENIFLFKLAKKINKDIHCILGGPHPSLIPEDFLKTGQPVDTVCIGEGDNTIVEVLREVLKPKDQQEFKQIKGIAYRKNDNVIITKPRPLIKDLDTLPLPAYHMIPMERYQWKDSLWKNGSSIHHSRGCIGDCNFCACWPLMGDRKNSSEPMNPTPKWRTKSVKKTMEEMQIISQKYKKTFFMFVDDCWNVNPKWNEEFADQKKEWGIEGGWFAFMRADLIIRDWKLGIMKKIYESELAHVIVGVERATQKSLNSLNKAIYSPSKIHLAVQIMKQTCPNTFLHGTFINGLWDDTEEDIIDNARFAKHIGLDYPSFHCVTPFPGTGLWKDAMDKKILPTTNWDYYDFFTPLLPTKHLTRAEVAKANQKANMYFVANPLWFFKGLLSKSEVKRWNYWWFVRQILKMTVNTVLLGRNPLKNDPIAKNTGYLRLEEPKWFWN